MLLVRCHVIDMATVDDEPARVTPVTHWPRAGAMLCGVFWVVIGRDNVGEFPILLRDADALPGGKFCWRLIAQTDDEVVAAGVMDLLVRRCFSQPPSVS